MQFDMDERSSACKKWLADALAYEALASYENKSSMIELLKDATRRIMQIAKHVGVSAELSDLDSQSATDFYKRVLLVMISTRVCTGLDRQFQYYVNEDEGTLESLLEIMEAHTCLFTANAHTYRSMWFATLKIVLSTCAQHSSQKSLQILEKHMSNLNEDEQNQCHEIIRSKPTEDYVTYAEFMWKQLSAINTYVGVPFLNKIHHRLSQTSDENSHCVDFKKHQQRINECVNRWQPTLAESPALEGCEKNHSDADTSVDKLLSQQRQETMIIDPVPSIASTTIISRVWPIELDSYIIFGAYKFGIGKWAPIKRSFPFPEDKSNHQIKDRWRTMIKKKLVVLGPDGKIADVNECYSDYIKTKREHGILKLQHVLEEPCATSTQVDMSSTEAHESTYDENITCGPSTSTADNTKGVSKRAHPSGKKNVSGAKKYYRKLVFDYSS